MLNRVVNTNFFNTIHYIFIQSNCNLLHISILGMTSLLFHKALKNRWYIINLVHSPSSHFFFFFHSPSSHDKNCSTNLSHDKRAENFTDTRKNWKSQSHKTIFIIFSSDFQENLPHQELCKCTKHHFI